MGQIREVDVAERLGQLVRFGLFVLLAQVCLALPGHAAPYAALVMDARSGKVLLADNADTRLHPASLTKMMTLYIVFEAVKKGELSLDNSVSISKKAASEPPSKLGLKPGQRIKLRYLVRAAAVKSANDAATALAEAVSGSEAAFSRRMNRTAKALGMTRTTFKNAHGLTESGHLSTARDMAILGRHLLYDHPEYYNLFSRRSTHAGIREVANTNRRFLADYRGADGIKTGYTRAAGFNLVASAERGSERVIAAMFGGRSTAQRNKKVAELLDFGFRKAPSRVAVRLPEKPTYADQSQPAGKTIRVVRAVAASPLPVPRPVTAVEPPEDMLVAMAETISETVTAIQVQPEGSAEKTQDGAGTEQLAEAGAVKMLPLARPESLAAADEADPEEPVLASLQVAEKPAHLPRPRPESIALAVAASVPQPPAEPVVVTRLSTSGDRHYGINVGRYTSRYEAERILLKTALAELDTLDGALRKVASTSQGHNANFVGMTRDAAERACLRLQAREIPCTTLGPT